MSIEINIAIDNFDLSNDRLIPDVNSICFHGDQGLLSQLRGRGTAENRQNQNDGQYSHTGPQNVGNLRLVQNGERYKCLS